MRAPVEQAGIQPLAVPSTSSLFDVPASPSLKTPSSMKGVLSSSSDKPVLQLHEPDNPAIDYIGRWDDSQTARWAGSSIRFAFDGPLLFLTPGPSTLSSNSPTVGWTVYTQTDPATSAGSSTTTTYTTTARPGVSIRLWPPEGNKSERTSPPPRSLTPSNSQKFSPSPSRPQSRQSLREGEQLGNDEVKIVEVTLLDWGSVLQVAHFQTLAGYTITPAFPEGLASLPTLLFVGDSLTSGFKPISSFNDPTPPSQLGSQVEAEDQWADYNGFFDAFPSHLKNLISPGARVYSIAFPGIRLVDDLEGESEGMESKWFKRGPLETSMGDEGDAHAGVDWDFKERENDTGPTHILIQLGTNDVVPVEDFTTTYRNFLNMLKETHGRRTGDILVLSPFGYRQISSDTVSTTDGGNDSHEDTDNDKCEYVTDYDEEALRTMVVKLSREWQEEDDMASGNFPSTPVLELAKLQLNRLTPLSDASDQPLASHLSIPSFQRQPSYFSTRHLIIPSDASSTPKATPLQTSKSSDLPPTRRPALIVRPSSTQAALVPTSKGTKARLHFVSTKGWLDSRSDTFDGLHPTRSGAAKIAQRLGDWFAENGFLVESTTEDGAAN